MKYLVMFLFIILPFIGFADSPKLEDVRLLFHQSQESQKTCTQLIELLQPYTEKNNSLFLGYRGCATMMMAKHAINPFSKLSYFRKGKLLLEKAIQFDPKNIELRFLRYTVQYNVPSFLNYDSNQKQDRLFLLQSVNSLNDQKLKKIITSFLSDNNKI